VLLQNVLSHAQPRSNHHVSGHRARIRGTKVGHGHLPTLRGFYSSDCHCVTHSEATRKGRGPLELRRFLERGSRCVRLTTLDGCVMEETDET
jgi:hypothetical protein